MANFRGKGSMTQRPLIAVWKDSQYTTLEGTSDGQVTGAYVDVQLDQSDLTPEDVKAGKAQTNPHLQNTLTEYKDRETGEMKKSMDHTVWYSIRQLNAMSGGGFPKKTEDGRNVLAFTSSIGSRQVKDKESDEPKTRMLVLCPKSLDKVPAEDLEKVKAWNEKHTITPKPGFDASILEKQEAVVAAAKKYRDEQRAASKAAELEAKAPEAAVDEDFVEFE